MNILEKKRQRGEALMRRAREAGWVCPACGARDFARDDLLDPTGFQCGRCRTIVAAVALDGVTSSRCSVCDIFMSALAAGRFDAAPDAKCHLNDHQPDPLRDDRLAMVRALRRGARFAEDQARRARRRQ